MAIRLLFVDDDPNVLAGLRRSLHGMRKEWEMEFVTGGAEALAALSQARFDVVVSDMRMPQMDGAELLAEVKARHPEILRIILSGHSEQELILRSIGPTHQYLAKPCDADELKRTITCGVRLQTLLGDPRLKKVVSGMNRIPSMPALFRELVAEIQSPNASLGKVGSIISRDPGMTAQILRLVNSAYFGLSHKISVPAQAVTMLGLATISALVLSVQAFNEVDEATKVELGFDGLWRHSLTTAVYARAIGSALSADRELTDKAFTAGVVHDIGRLVFGVNFPAQHRKVLQLAAEQGLGLCEAEKVVFGATHGEIGAYILGLWGLPNPIIEALAFHHHPRQAANQELSPLTLVHIADVVALEQAPPDDAPARPALDLVYLNKLGLAARVDELREVCRTASPAEV